MGCDTHVVDLVQACIPTNVSDNHVYVVRSYFLDLLVSTPQAGNFLVLGPDMGQDPNEPHQQSDTRYAKDYVHDGDKATLIDMRQLFLAMICIRLDLDGFSEMKRRCWHYLSSWLISCDSRSKFT